ncbi:MAG: type II secretion system protein [Planctomycetaceae bacterium]
MSLRMNVPVPRHAASPRRGFSLVELLIVIAIISILVGLILAGIGPVRNRVRVAEVRTEISGLESGITQFTGEFGQEPPSFITLYEVGADWDTTSRTLMRQLWSSFKFDMDRDIDKDTMVGETDPDGDGKNGITLTGDECLLFFLGGPDTINVAGSAVANGFSKNPEDPFAAGGTRVGPFFEFDPDRMIDLDGDRAHAYAHKFPASQAPYLYLSSYEGRGYRATDADMNGDGTADITDVYLQRDDDTSTANVNEKIPWKAKSYQIISAGQDGEFGVGGLWSNDDGFKSRAGTLPDRDNVTNFASGTLE